MNKSRQLMTALLIGGSLTLAAMPAVQAETEIDKPTPREHCSQHGLRQDGSRQHGGGMRPDQGMAPRFLRGLELTDEQQDKVFAIMHPLMPAEREHHKSIQSLREQQRALTLSGNYDAGKLQKLVEAEAREHSQHQLQMAEARHKIYQLLTDEQKAKLAERQQSRAG